MLPQNSYIKLQVNLAFEFCHFHCVALVANEGLLDFVAQKLHDEDRVKLCTDSGDGHVTKTIL